MLFSLLGIYANKTVSAHSGNASLACIRIDAAKAKDELDAT